MKARKTISIDDDVLEMIKDLAKAQRTSVSALITRWVLEKGTPPDRPPASPEIPIPPARGHGRLKPNATNTTRG